jgi:hypothetical protein
MNKKIQYLLWFVLILCGRDAVVGQTAASSHAFVLARVKYSGGGDWYNDPSIIPNMLNYLGTHTNMATANQEARVSLMDESLFSYPFLFMTGHGRISFSEQETSRLRSYLLQGGFLFADDDYGMDEHFRREMKKVFPDKELLEIPYAHPIYYVQFPFASGLPKIHEHDGGAPRGYGYFHEGRLVVFYAFNTNISDGWADPDVHGDPPDKREQAFRMGANVIVYALTH